MVTPPPPNDKAITKTVSLPSSLWDQLDAHAKLSDGDRSACLKRLVLAELGDPAEDTALTTLAMTHARHLGRPLAKLFTGPLSRHSQGEVASWLLEALVQYAEAGLPVEFPLGIAPQELTPTPFLTPARYSAISRTTGAQLSSTELELFKREMLRRKLMHALRHALTEHLLLAPDEHTRQQLIQAMPSSEYPETDDNALKAAEGADSPSHTSPDWNIALDLLDLLEKGAPPADKKLSSVSGVTAPPSVHSPEPPEPPRPVKNRGHLRVHLSTPSPETPPQSQKTGEG